MKTPATNGHTLKPSTTASAQEIDRFTSIADAWWDPDGEFRPLHQLNPLRIAYIRDRIAEHFGRDRLAKRPLAGLRLLDVGCGGGLLAEPMVRLGATVTGIDASEKSVRIAQIHALQQELSIRYLCLLPEDLARQRDAFDVVLNMEVIEHVTDLDVFLKACSAVLKPGGAMVVATLNRTIKSLALAKIGAEYVLRWLPRGTHDWAKFVKPSELALALGRQGIDIRDVKGMAFNPLSGRWSLTRDVSVNYVAFGVKC